MGFNLLDLFLPREKKFFQYMKEQIECFINASNAFKDLVYHIEEYNEDDLKKKIHIIKDCEANGDMIERKIIDELHETFITPIDREDIHTLATNIDRSIDILNSITRKIEIYQITKLPSNVCEFVDLIIVMGEMMKEIMVELENKRDIAVIQTKMHSIENQGDDLFHNCMARLFTMKHDPVDIIRFKEVYEHLESIIDSIDYIGKIVRGIKVKMG